MSQICFLNVNLPQNEDLSLYKAPHPIPKVSTIERFHCSTPHSQSPQPPFFLHNIGEKDWQCRLGTRLVSGPSLHVHNILTVAPNGMLCSKLRAVMCLVSLTLTRFPPTTLA